MQIKKRCGKINCRNFVEDVSQSYCEKHKGYTNKQYNQFRETYNKEYINFYKSTAWVKLRESVMREQQYLCQDCKDKGIIKVGEELHHVISTRTEEGWKKRLDRKGLRLLCRECHAIHSAREKKERGY